MNLRTRIVRDSGIVGGQPVFRGTRVTFAPCWPALAEGATTAEILADFPTLAPDDALASSAFAATSAQEALPAVTTVSG